MKNLIRPKFILSASLCLFIVFAGCHNGNKQSQQNQKEGVNNAQGNSVRVVIDSIPLTTQKIDMATYDTTHDFKMYYGEPIPIPAFDFQVDISKKSLVELRLLKNEIYARHGYLFMDAILRGYFNQFDWYQPIFWDTGFKVSLSKQEIDFIGRVNDRYNQQLQQNYIVKDGKKFANMNNIMNLIQFKYVSDTLMNHINKDGFAIVPARNMQLFDVYDQNQYKAIPSFVTTDTYLQLLYLHLRHILEGMEEEKFIPTMDTVVECLYRQSMSEAKSKDGMVQKAASFNATYYAICSYLLKNETLPVPASMKGVYDYEIAHITNDNPDRGSMLMNDTLFDYTQLKPRGHYTSTEALQGYFKCLKWMMTTPYHANDADRLAALVLTAINSNKLKSAGGRSVSNLYNSIDGTIGFLIGAPDNLSLNDITKVLHEEGLSDKPETEILTSQNLDKIAARLKQMDPQQIVAHGTDARTQKVMNMTNVFFMPGRYTVDAEILQRLIHVLKPNPMRLFPKGLDVFATFGNKTAENILMNTYHENATWPAYGDTLKTLQDKFNNFNGYDNNIYNKMIGTLITLQKPNDSLPYYMHSDAWARKTLNTSLASWTELKHTVVLYAKQANGAECGEGGGPPPPVYPGYVEPNVAFWQNCISLLNLMDKKMEENNLATDHFKLVNSKLENMATLFLTISEEEMKGYDLEEAEFDKIMWIGGEIESLSNQIANSDKGLELDDDPERNVGLATDVYTYDDKCLEEATGWGNEIYAVVQINGFLYLARGAVFSYYEFQQPSSDRLTDEEWQAKMEKDDLPPIPIWMNDLMAPIKPLETKSFYTYSANPSSLVGQ